MHKKDQREIPPGGRLTTTRRHDHEVARWPVDYDDPSTLQHVDEFIDSPLGLDVIKFLQSKLLKFKK